MLTNTAIYIYIYKDALNEFCTTKCDTSIIFKLRRTWRQICGFGAPQCGPCRRPFEGLLGGVVQEHRLLCHPVGSDNHAQGHSYGSSYTRRAWIFVLAFGWLLYTRAQHFLWICIHTQTTTINSDLCPPMPIHSMTCAHPCYSNCAHVFKNCVMCITRLHRVLVGSDK